jgi:hypothetical protein
MRCRAALLLGALVALSAASAAEIDLGHQKIALDGAPAAVLTVDLDRDGRRDLALVLVSTSWGQIGVDELQEIDELGTYVEVLTVVPALFDHRELAVHLGGPDGRFATEALRLELPDSVHTLLAGPSSAPLLAWTNDGVATIEIGLEGLRLEPRIVARSPLAGSATLLADLPLTTDVDGDGEVDLLLPVAGGLAVHLATPAGLATAAAAVLRVPLEERLPGDASHYRTGTLRNVPLPVPIDLDGDGLPELLFRNHDKRWNEIRALPNLGGGRFGAPVDPLAGRDRDAEEEVVWIGDFDGLPGAELITQEELETESDSVRAELAEARRPHSRYRVHAIGSDLRWRPEPQHEYELEGYIFGGGEEIGLPAGARDLDGDGRIDLVALTLDFSLIQALRVVTARSLRLGIDFAPHCQSDAGGLRARADQDLGGRFTLRLDRLGVGQLSSFGGDFDGDGRADYLQLGRGRRVAVRLGRPGCVYSRATSTTFELAAEPADLALVRVVDLDDDGRSDLAVTFPPPPGAVDGRGSLDLYLSGAGQ